MNMKFCAWIDETETGLIVSPWFPVFEMAELHPAAQLGGMIWEEEMLSDGRIVWNQYERDQDGEWVPEIGGMGPDQPVRP